MSALRWLPRLAADRSAAPCRVIGRKGSTPALLLTGARPPADCGGPRSLERWLRDPEPWCPGPADELPAWRRGGAAADRRVPEPQSLASHATRLRASPGGEGFDVADQLVRQGPHSLPADPGHVG